MEARYCSEFKYLEFIYVNARTITDIYNFFRHILRWKVNNTYFAFSHHVEAVILITDDTADQRR